MTAPNARRCWTEEDTRALHAMRREGVSLAAIAAILGRTEKACEHHLYETSEPSRRYVPTDRIVAAVSEHFDVPPAQLLGLSRRRPVARPRQLAMYLTRRITGRSLPQIGRWFGRDHSTVVHAVRTTEARRRESPELDRDIRILTAALAPAAAEQPQAQGEV